MSRIRTRISTAALAAIIAGASLGSVTAEDAVAKRGKAATSSKSKAATASKSKVRGKAGEARWVVRAAGRKVG